MFLDNHKVIINEAIYIISIISSPLPAFNQRHKSLILYTS